MRVLIVAIAFIVAACGPSTESSQDVPDPNERVLPFGAIVANGENWRFIADPAAQAISFVVDDGAEPVEVAETWAPPQTTETGYRLSSGELAIDLVEELCTQDSVAYPMRATVTHVTDRYEGCAAMRWDHQLVALMPQIDACIARSPQTRWVSYAGAQLDDSMLVRLVADGGGFDCYVTLGAMPQVTSFTPRNETVRFATDHAALFVRGPGENPAGECYEAPEVRGANGELLGWMMDPLGC